MSQSEPAYNLKAVIRETGLSPEVLRAWERRYGLPKPERTMGGHRLYSLRDIAMLKWLVNRQQEGLSISRAVELWKSLEDEGQDPLQMEAERELPIAAGGPALDELRQRWINACLQFDEQAANTALSQVLAVASPETACLEVLQKGLAEIGAMWYAGKVSVQQEHFASSLAMRRLHALVAAAPVPTRPGVILAACPPGEDHEFGLLLSTFLLRWRGWQVVYLGANVPIARLEDAIRATSPSLLLSLAQTLPAAASLREMSLFLLQEGLPLGYGGFIFNQLPKLRDLIPGRFLGADFTQVPNEVEQAITRAVKPLQPRDLPEQYQQALESYQQKLPFIHQDVVAEMKKVGVKPSHLDIADRFMTQHVIAALSLGDACLFNHSLLWVEHLLKNYGLPDSFMPAFADAYRKALAAHLDSGLDLFTDCLDNYLKEE
jgi:MerR family transcriptional regulator, light-induced transcriptional regulator